MRSYLLFGQHNPLCAVVRHFCRFGNSEKRTQFVWLTNLHLFLIDDTNVQK